MSKEYFNPEDLKKFGSITDFQEEYGNKFFEWYGKVFEEGALTSREKALIALAVAHAVRGPPFANRLRSKSAMMICSHIEEPDSHRAPRRCFT